MSHSLIQDAKTHLNNRTRGEAERIARMTAAGVPFHDRAALEQWLLAAQDAVHEAVGGIYHARAARVPACRVARVTIEATRVNAGETGQHEDGERFFVEAGFWYVVVYGGTSSGFFGTQDFDATSATEAEQAVRDRLMSRGDHFRTRAEALAALPRLIEVRAARVASK